MSYIENLLEKAKEQHQAGNLAGSLCCTFEAVGLLQQEMKAKDAVHSRQQKIMRNILELAEQAYLVKGDDGFETAPWDIGSARATVGADK